MPFSSHSPPNVAFLRFTLTRLPSMLMVRSAVKRCHPCVHSASNTLLSPRRVQVPFQPPSVTRHVLPRPHPFACSPVAYQTAGRSPLQRTVGRRTCGRVVPRCRQAHERERCPERVESRRQLAFMLREPKPRGARKRAVNAEDDRAEASERGAWARTECSVRRGRNENASVNR